MVREWLLGAAVASAIGFFSVQQLVFTRTEATELKEHLQEIEAMRDQRLNHMEKVLDQIQDDIKGLSRREK